MHHPSLLLVASPEQKGVITLRKDHRLLARTPRSGPVMILDDNSCNISFIPDEKPKNTEEDQKQVLKSEHIINCMHKNLSDQLASSAS